MSKARYSVTNSLLCPCDRSSVQSPTELKFKSHAVAADLQTKRSSHSVVDNIHVEQLNKCQLQGLAIRWGLRADLLCMFAACGVGCRGAVHQALHVTAAPAEQRCCILLNLGLPERCFAKTCIHTALFQCCRHGRVHPCIVCLYQLEHRAQNAAKTN